MPVATRFGRLYLGNKMSGIPYFNAPWFDMMTGALMVVPGIEYIFNPAQHDRDNGFDPMTCPSGTLAEALAHGFVLREALGADWGWIAANSDGLIIGPEWVTSPGTISEVACHQALKLPVWSAATFIKNYDHPGIFNMTLPPLSLLMME